MGVATALKYIRHIECMYVVIQEYSEIFIVTSIPGNKALVHLLSETLKSCVIFCSGCECPFGGTSKTNIDFTSKYKD